MSNKRSAPGIGDSLGQSIPIDMAAEGIDPRVIEALSRWRDADSHSLAALASLLTTHASDRAVDSVGYLSALHGFVAEQITVDTLSKTHAVVFPHATTVPGWDLIVNGQPLQIKEGTTAYELVHHALERYPNIRSFATDPATAARLKSEGIDAIGIPGLEPAHISSISERTLYGVGDLAGAGALHLPILTTVFSTCRYWSIFDSELSDGRTALGNALLDIGAQSVGSAIGLKAGAIAVVASGAFALSALPITAAAILGALAARGAVNAHRRKHLDYLLDHLDETRRTAETASEITIELSRESLMRGLSKIDATRNDAAREAKLEVITEYALLLERLSIIAAKVSTAFGSIKAEADKHGIPLPVLETP